MQNKNIEDLRIYEGLSQREVARLINCSYSAYRNYEKGIRNIPTLKAIKLAKHYNVTLDYLLEVSSEKGTFKCICDIPQMKLKYFRELNKLTQKQLSDILFCWEDIYRRYEAEIDPIPIWVVIRLAEIYEITTDCLLGLE